MLRAGAAVGTVAGLSAAGVLGAGTASAVTATHGSTRRLPYPRDITDTSHATPEVAAILRGYFTAKSEHDTATLMSYFSTSDACYIDASVGVVLPDWQSINGFFVSIFAQAPASAISYPLTIVGDARSAAVEFVDSPTFFAGEEVRPVSSVTFDGDGKIVRWVDYWDGRSALLANSITGAYPTDFSDYQQNTDPAVVRAVTKLQAAFSVGDSAAAAALLSVDVVHEDMALHTRLRGRIQAQRYYTRALGLLPYGLGADLLHVEGGSRGGGYEWSASPGAAPMRRGHTLIELDGTGLISRVVAMYDSSVLSDNAYRSLVGFAAEAPPA